MLAWNCPGVVWARYWQVTLRAALISAVVPPHPRKLSSASYAVSTLSIAVYIWVVSDASASSPWAVVRASSQTDESGP